MWNRFLFKSQAYKEEPHVPQNPWIRGLPLSAEVFMYSEAPPVISKSKRPVASP